MRTLVEYRWTPANKLMLMKMREIGCSWRAIAVQVGRTPAACNAMYNLLLKDEINTTKAMNAIYKPIDDALAKAINIAADEYRRYSSAPAPDDGYSAGEADKYSNVIAILELARAAGKAIAGQDEGGGDAKLERQDA